MDVSAESGCRGRSACSKFLPDSRRRPPGAARRCVRCSRKRSHETCGLRPVPARRAAAWSPLLAASASSVQQRRVLAPWAYGRPGAHTWGMRAPKRHRPLRRARAAVPADVDLEAVAARVRYVGSSEHKTYPSFAGSPHPRADASKCDPSITDSSVVTLWLQDAIRSGNIGSLWEGDFPRYAWAAVGGVYYEGRLVNRVQGAYKGYPITDNEWKIIPQAEEWR